MKLLTLRRNRKPDLPGITGVARLDRRTKNVLQRLKPGDIAIIDHIDLDRVSAEALVAAGAAAVVNSAPSISGRYPNLGPGILVRTGVPLLDNVGEEIHGIISDGDKVRLEGKVLFRGDDVVAEGDEQTVESVDAALEEAKTGMATQLGAFTANAMEYLRRERELLLDAVGVPAIETDLRGRHVVVVVPGRDGRADLAMLRRYVREYKPVLVGVDAGADLLLDAGHDPDLIVGDMDTISESALRCGAELVVHVHRDGRNPGLARLERQGVEAVMFPATGTSQDVALLLADSYDAGLIVTAGTHETLVEFLDKERAGTASTFLTRLRVGGKLVDAQAVSQLNRPGVRARHIVAILLVGLIAVGVALAATPVGQEWYDVAVTELRALLDAAIGLVA